MVNKGWSYTILKIDKSIWHHFMHVSRIQRQKNHSRRATNKMSSQVAYQVICIKKLFLFEEWYLCFRKIESIEIIKESLPFFFPRYPQQPSALRVRHNKKIHQQKHWKYFQQSPKVIDKTFWTNSKTVINFYPNTSLGKQNSLSL